MGITQFISKVCVQPAVYWGAPVPDGFGGMEYATPVEVLVRWAEKVQVVVDAQGKQVVSTSEVMVQQQMATEGLLYLGELTTLTPLQKTRPTDILGVHEIKAFTKVPLIKSKTVFIYTAFLAKKIL